MVWIICGWVVWLKKDFTEMPEKWLIVALVRTTIVIIFFNVVLYLFQIQTVAFALFSLPLLLTDPYIWIY